MSNSKIIKSSLLSNELQPILAKAFSDLGFPTEEAVLINATDVKFGDLQCNSALKLARIQRKNPAEIATTIKDKLIENGIEDSYKVSTIGGYVNISISNKHIAELVGKLATTGEVDFPPDKNNISTIILDYGGPNVAKPLHVGHMRSAVIGNTLQRILQHQGHKVIGDIHWGDWGAPMGMVIALIKEKYPDLPYFKKDFSGPFPSEPPVTLEDLNKLYPEAAKRYKTERPDDAVGERREGGAFWLAANEVTAALQSGNNPGCMALWEHLCNLTKKSALSTFSQFNVSFDKLMGESSVQAILPVMVRDLLDRGIAIKENGAVIIPVSKDDDTHPLPPLMLITSTGAYTYAATDLATIKSRQDEFHPNQMIYVVDHRQSDHFAALARAAMKAGYIDDVSRIQHIAFGTVNGKDGKPFKTRDGNAMQLEQLLEIAVDAESQKVASNTASDLIRPIAVGAVKFAELSNKPDASYVFDPDAFLKSEGKTGIYVMYAAARIQSILDKLVQSDPSYSDKKTYTIDPNLLKTSFEARELAKTLLSFPEVTAQAAKAFNPSIVVDHLYDLSKLMSQFLRNEQVLAEVNSERKESKIGLLKASCTQMKQCFDLLGIDMPKRMPELTKATAITDSSRETREKM